MSCEKNHHEECHVRAEALVAKVKQLVHEGNVRHLVIRSSNGRTMVEIPLTVGAVGVLLAPVWLAVGAVAALAADCTILVERCAD